MLLFNSTGIQKLIWNVMVSYQSFSHLRQEFDITVVQLLLHRYLHTTIVTSYFHYIINVYVTVCLP